MVRYGFLVILVGLVALYGQVTGQTPPIYVTPGLTTAPSLRYGLILKELSAVTQGRAALTTTLNQYKSQLNTLKQQIKQKKDACSCADETTVVFSVHLNQDVNVLGVDQPYPFDNVTLNVGNAFDVRHAQFRAPVDGTYAFYITLATHAGYTLAADIMLNGTPVVKIRTGNPNQLHVGSNAVTLHLTKGDDVWVQHSHAPTDSNRLYHDEGKLSTFTGYLVNKD